MHECRKKARMVLRTFTGHVATEEKIRVKIRTTYQWPSQPLQAWQEDRKLGNSSDLLRLGLYTKFAAEIPDFQVPWTVGDQGATVVDVVRMQDTERLDPDNETELVPCATYDMRTHYMKRLLHHEMDFMKENELARRAMQEDEIKWQLRWQGEEEKSPTPQAPTPGRKARSCRQLRPGERKIGLYLGDAPNPDTTCRIIPAVAQLLPKRLDQYQPAKGFPFNEIATQKLWDEVGKLSSALGDHPWRSGWLKYTVKDRVKDSDGVTRSRTRYWKVEDGKQLGMLLQHHSEFHGGNDKQPFRLEYMEGKNTSFT